MSRQKALNATIKSLSLKKGDILVIQRDYATSTPQWLAALKDAGKIAGISFSVPIVLVDDIDSIAVVRMGQNG